MKISALPLTLVLAALTLPLVFALTLAAPAQARDEPDHRDRVSSLLLQIQQRMGVAVQMTGNSIPPMVITEQTGVVVNKTPINIAEIEITSLTPADKFSYAITPLIVVLAMGSVLLVWVGLAQKVSQDAV